MKEAIVSISIILTIILFCVFSTFYTEKVCSDLDNNLESIIRDVEADEWVSAKAKAENLTNDYEKSKKPLKCFLAHEMLDTVDEHLARIEASVKLKNKSSVIIEAKTLISHIKEVEKAEKATLENIF